MDLFADSCAIGPKALQVNRPIFQTVLNDLQPGDALVVWDLDRAFRSTIDAIQTAEALRAQKIELKIVNLNLDTSTPAGMLVYTVLSACAEFERRIIGQRTREGLQAARARGQRLGRPPKLSRDDLIDAMHRSTNGEPLKSIAHEHGMQTWSLRRALKRLDSAPP